MNSEESFLEALRESPQDNDLRMVFGDWLEEQGDGRGEILRLSVRLATLAADDPTRSQVERQVTRLRRRDEAAWLGPLQGHVEGWQVRRGLLHLVASAEDLAGVVREAGSVLPWLEGLTLWGELGHVERVLSRLEGCPHLNTLDLGGNHLGPTLTGALLQAPFLAQLHTLDLRENNLGAEGVVDLARTEALSRLAVLNLTSNELGAEGMHALVNSDYLDRLNELMLGNNGLGDEGVAWFLSRNREDFAELYALSLGENGIGPQGAESLAGVHCLRALTTLDLWNNRLGPDGVRALTRTPFLCGLTSLDLEGNQMGNRGAAALANSADTTALRDLALGNNAISDPGAQAFAASNLGSLTRLDLEDNNIRGPGARALLNSKSLAGVSCFVLHANNISETEAAKLRSQFGSRVQI